MNATLIAQVPNVDIVEPATEGEKLTELYAVELAYVGGGMGNVMFM